MDVREERNRCSARRKKAEAQCEVWDFACTSAGNEHQALSFAGYPASWDRSSREKTAPIAVLARLSANAWPPGKTSNAPDVRRPYKTNRAGRASANPRTNFFEASAR